MSLEDMPYLQQAPDQVPQAATVLTASSQSVSSEPSAQTNECRESCGNEYSRKGDQC